ncbi:MAG: class I SAM-dependent methyltransferase [Rhodospirillales bacterium]|nr:class I SAM-dependent methyltransferase [Rhodospirillales bacterium]MCW8862386.1 class I SAM-dependent methyltransferase [Rhodospirillales bacterium]MCW8951364.1 class I SAM-dependent methyltransferase [Rhodospirillales bacterium]MCW8970438.1 class I SAM-dependent methyltransferase [Rhodospirillales bacterium]MCW9001272.1 class I SAM-dependent methyltransferase [Rhodospirillales bacterium]
MPTPPALPTILSAVARSYERAFDERGASPGGVLWRNAWGQTLRFEMLAGILEGEARDDVTIIDFGCGYGALFEHLAEHPCLRHGRYTGLDINEKCLDAARKKITDPRAMFIKSHRATEKADYVFISGTFNLKSSTTNDNWLRFVEETLGDLWQKTRRGMAFNMLAPRRLLKRKSLFYSPTEPFVTFCREELNAETTLASGYGLDEWTLLLRRRPEKAVSA